MKNMKHTKGEWKVCYVNLRECYKIRSKGTLIAIVQKKPVPPDEYEANAKLIAQSPVMYTFIMDWIEAMEDKGKLTIHETALMDSAKQIAKDLS